MKKTHWRSYLRIGVSMVVIASQLCMSSIAFAVEDSETPPPVDTPTTQEQTLPPQVQEEESTSSSSETEDQNTENSTSTPSSTAETSEENVPDDDEQEAEAPARFVALAAPFPPIPCANGATYASNVLGSSQGTLKDGSPITDPNRMDPNGALGAPNGNFFSIGKNGSITVGFTGFVVNVPGNDLSFHEVTNGRDTYPEEVASVEVSQDGVTWFAAGTVSGQTNGGVNYIDFAPTGLTWVKYVKIADATNFALHNNAADGYDLEAVDAVYEACATLALQKTGSYDSVTGKIKFTINWQVLGTGTLTNVFITDMIPSGATLVPGSITPPGIFDGVDSIIWNLGSKVAPAAGNVMFEVTVNAAASFNTWASHVVSSNQGKKQDLVTVVDPIRSMATSTLGAPQSAGNVYDNPLPPLLGQFYSLGFNQAPVGGNVVVTFDQPVYNGPGNDLKVFEVTSGDGYHDEQVTVEVSNDAVVWNNVGVVVRDGEVDLGSNLSAHYIRVSDVSDKNLFDADADAYDVDAVKAIHILPDVCDIENEANATWKLNGAPFGTTAATKVTVNNKACDPKQQFSISGMKWDDADGDAVKDGGESGLPDWVIYLDANINGVLDSGEATTTTDSLGNYTFTNLDTGVYEVREVNQSGWNQTYPTPAFFGKHVVVLSTANEVGKNFGNKQQSNAPLVDNTPSPSGGGTDSLHSISGQKWSDLNSDGVKDVGEPVLSGFDIYVDLNGNGGKDPGEASAVTDASGNYTIGGLVSGSYEVKEVNQSGFVQTFPGAGAGFKHVVVIANINITGKDFGNHQNNDLKIQTGDGGGGLVSLASPTSGGVGDQGGNGGNGGGSGSNANDGQNGQVLGVSDFPNMGGNNEGQVLGASTEELPRTGMSLVVYMLGMVSLLTLSILFSYRKVSLR